MSKVYVVQDQPGKNILPAQAYGEINVLLDSNKQIRFSTGQVVNQLKVALSGFSDEDYLLLIGDPVAIGVATALAAEWNQGRVKFLKWDRQEMQYYVVSVNIHSTVERREDEKFND